MRQGAATSASAEARLRRLRLPLGVLVAGVLVLALLLGARSLHLRTQAEDAAWVQAVGTIEADVAISHLWLEEYVSGDEVDLDEIEFRLNRAQRLVDELLEESDGTVRSALHQEPLWQETGLQATVLKESQRLRHSLDQFRQIAEDRRLGFERGLPVGVGSSFDVRYDAVFGRVLGHVEVLKATLRASREENRRRERRGTAVLIACWLGLIAVASAGLWRYEDRKRQAEAALDEHRRQLQRVQRTEAVGRLAGGLSHDLGNYLAAIRAQCELLLRKAARAETIPSDVATAKLTTALGVVDKASALLRRLLAFHRGARIESLVTIDLNETLHGLEPMIRAALGRSVDLHLDLDPALWPVAADPVGLEQAVINLAVNARDAMPEGGRLTLTTANRAAAGLDGADQVRLVVADEGVGIEADVLDRIFDPFWSTKGDTGHSGLGLAIVDTVVHQMGGTVSVDSEPGRGTAFLIDLPRCG